MARILLVEDEPNISAIILFKLRREGHDVVLVETAEAARRSAVRHDLLLLDSSLPGEDALALLAELHAAVPVVVMTESLDHRTPGLAQEMGAAAVVSKPFKPTVLARLVAEVAAAGKGDASHRAGTTAGELIATVGAPEGAA